MTGRSQVDNILPQILLELSSKNASFSTGVFPVNNNTNVILTLHTSLPSSLVASAKVQGSQDQSTWFDLPSTDISITTTDDVAWSINSLHGFIYLKLLVTITSGSANFLVYGRGA